MSIEKFEIDNEMRIELSRTHKCFQIVDDTARDDYGGAITFDLDQIDALGAAVEKLRAALKQDRTLRLSGQKMISQVELDSFRGRPDERIGALKERLAHEAMTAILAVGEDSFSLTMSFTAYHHMGINDETALPEIAGSVIKMTADVTFPSDAEGSEK